MNFAFLVDRYDQWHIEKDTSFALMLGAERKGHHVYRFFTNTITLEDGKVFVRAEHVRPQKNKTQPFLVQGTIRLSAEDIDVLFIRTDPPFDNTYLMTTWLLDHLPERIPVINKPAGIRACNEKIWAMQFADLIPPTLVTGNEAEMDIFIQRHENVIVKPTDSFGGQGVHLLKPHSEERHQILAGLSQNFTKEIILQKYLPEAEQGDKRILLLNGEPLGAVLRVHAADDFRNNFMAGGKPHPAKITERDEEIIRHLKPHLQKLGLYFVGIDIIGPYLTEVNVTSPTCLQEINTIENAQLEDKVIAFAEKCVDQARNLPKI